MSKANARDWREQQKQDEADVEDLERNSERLRYLANRKYEYPDSDRLRQLGHGDVAALIDAASSKLNDAYSLLCRKLEKQN